jgi:uncharacterized repeat protein (TIGR03809 family)
MPDRQAPRSYDLLARQWRDLADRRCEHFADLYRTGRWKLYYEEEQEFLACMREANDAADTWHRLAPDETPSAG